MPIRTFLALDLDEASRDRLEAVQQVIVDPSSKINWVNRRNLHVTLNFLGDVPDEVLAEVCDLVAGVAGEFQPFDFDVRGLRCMPPGGAPRMIWANVDEPSAALFDMQRALAEAMVGLRLRQEEREHRPHVTLARIKAAGNFRYLRSLAAEMADSDFGVQAATEVVAYASQLTKEGPVYTPIARAPLGDYE